MSKSAYEMLAALAALSVFAFAQPANALTMRECSEKYKTATPSDKMTWNDFRKAECGPDATMQMKPVKAAKPDKAAKAEKIAPAIEPAKEATVSQQECSTRYQAAKTGGTLGSMTWNEFRKAGCPTVIAKTTGAMVPTAAGMFPASISKKYANQSAGKARRMTCLDQYRANKAAGIDQPRWTQTGGGYYHECNTRLKPQ
jgi:hypothetical protein